MLLFCETPSDMKCNSLQYQLLTFDEHKPAPTHRHTQCMSTQMYVHTFLSLLNVGPQCFAEVTCNVYVCLSEQSLACM